MFELVFAICLAVFVSFFCSIAEAVLYSLPWSRIESLRAKDAASAEMLYAMRRDVEKPITAILTLNTVAHTIGASLAGAAWAGVFGSDTLALFALVFTVVILLFSEILPKTIGVTHNAALAPVLVRPISGLIWILYPVIKVCSYVSRLAGGGKAGPDANERDIKSLASLVYKAGVIESQEEKVIHNILALDTRTVRHIMTPRTVVYSLPMHETVDHVMEIESQWPHGKIPVWDKDSEDIVGVVTRRDVFLAMRTNAGQETLASLMEPADYVLDSLPLNRLLSRFLETRLHIFIVLDEFGGLAGVVTLEDVMEEILGHEIVDETDRAADLQSLARKRRKELLEKAGAGTGE